VFEQRRIVAGRRAPVAEFGVGAGVDRRAIICIDDVASRAAARAVIAGVVVGAEEIERGVEQPRARQADHDGIGSVLGAEAPFTEARARLARFFGPFRDADLRTEAAAALEETQDIAGLR